MTTNEVKAIIYDNFGFERKSINIKKVDSGKFGGLKEVFFSVKGIDYRAVFEGEEIYLEFYNSETDAIPFLEPVTDETAETE